MEVMLSNFSTGDLEVRNIRIKTQDEFDKMGIGDYFDSNEALPFKDFARSVNQLCVDFGLSHWVTNNGDITWRLTLTDESDHLMVAKIDFILVVAPINYIDDAINTLISKSGGWR